MSYEPALPHHLHSASSYYAQSIIRFITCRGACVILQYNIMNRNIHVQLMYVDKNALVKVNRQCVCGAI